MRLVGAQDVRVSGLLQGNATPEAKDVDHMKSHPSSFRDEFPFPEKGLGTSHCGRDTLCLRRDKPCRNREPERGEIVEECGCSKQNIASVWEQVFEFQRGDDFQSVVSSEHSAKQTTTKQPLQKCQTYQPDATSNPRDWLNDPLVFSRMCTFH